MLSKPVRTFEGIIYAGLRDPKSYHGRLPDRNNFAEWYEISRSEANEMLAHPMVGIPIRSEHTEDPELDIGVIKASRITDEGNWDIKYDIDATPGSAGEEVIAWIDLGYALSHSMTHSMTEIRDPRTGEMRLQLVPHEVSVVQEPAREGCHITAGRLPQSNWDSSKVENYKQRYNTRSGVISASRLSVARKRVPFASNIVCAHRPRFLIPPPTPEEESVTVSASSSSSSPPSAPTVVAAAASTMSIQPPSSSSSPLPSISTSLLDMTPPPSGGAQMGMQLHQQGIRLDGGGVLPMAIPHLVNIGSPPPAGTTTTTTTTTTSSATPTATSSSAASAPSMTAPSLLPGTPSVPVGTAPPSAPVVSVAAAKGDLIERTMLSLTSGAGYRTKEQLKDMQDLVLMTGAAAQRDKEDLETKAKYIAELETKAKAYEAREAAAEAERLREKNARHTTDAWKDNERAGITPQGTTARIASEIEGGAVDRAKAASQAFLAAPGGAAPAPVAADGMTPEMRIHASALAQALTFAFQRSTQLPSSNLFGQAMTSLSSPPPPSSSSVVSASASSSRMDEKYADEKRFSSSSSSSGVLVIKASKRDPNGHVYEEHEFVAGAHPHGIKPGRLTDSEKRNHIESARLGGRDSVRIAAGKRLMQSYGAERNVATVRASRDTARARGLEWQGGGFFKDSGGSVISLGGDGGDDEFPTHSEIRRPPHGSRGVAIVTASGGMLADIPAHRYFPHYVSAGCYRALTTVPREGDMVGVLRSKKMLAAFPPRSIDASASTATWR